MPDDDLNYAQMHARVEKRVRKRAEWLLHLSIYVTANLLIWALFLLIVSRTVGYDVLLLVPTLITLGWGVGLVAHGMDTYLQTGALDAMREREMRKEIALERMRRGLDEDDAISIKRKRESAMRLSDDGELLPADDDELESELADQQNQRRSSTLRSSSKK